MIFDRTQNDVDAAIRLRKEKVQFFQELTQEDIDILEKGMVTTNTLNRIENAQSTLKNIFNDMGYWNTPITNKSWDSTQKFDADELSRIFNNNDVLMEAFFVYKSTPKPSAPKYHFIEFNALERALYDLDLMINEVKSMYRECGDYYCGEDS